MVASKARELAQQAMEFWRRTDVRVNAGASVSDILRFEESTGVRLTTELREYFKIVNGMNNSCDGELLEFYSIAGLERFSSSYGVLEQYSECVNWYIIIDYCMRSHMFAVELLPEAHSTGPVIFINNHCVVAFQSFCELLQAYLQCPDDVAQFQ